SERVDAGDRARGRRPGRAGVSRVLAFPRGASVHRQSRDDDGAFQRHALRRRVDRARAADAAAIRVQRHGPPRPGGPHPERIAHSVRPRLGAHLSVAGGLPRAVERAVLHGCASLQIFAKNASQWKGRALPREEIREFRARVRASGIWPVVSHASYLINLATANRALRQQSLEAMGDELDRAEAPGLLGVVLHPGCFTAGTEADGLDFVADGLLQLLRERRRGKTMVLLEQTAGQGTALGATFEQLASIIAKMNDH